MRPYRLNEADLQIPDGWQDNTIHSFVLPGDGGGAASLVITRDMEAGDVDLSAYADQQLVRSAQQLPSYTLLSREQRAIANRPATQSDFTWLTPEGISVRQRQACLRLSGLVLVITLTGRNASFADYEPVWGQVMDSIKLRPNEDS